MKKCETTSLSLLWKGGSGPFVTADGRSETALRTHHYLIPLHIVCQGEKSTVKGSPLLPQGRLFSAVAVSRKKSIYFNRPPPAPLGATGSGPISHLAVVSCLRTAPSDISTLPTPPKKRPS